MPVETYKKPGELADLYQDQYLEQKQRLKNHMLLLQDLIENSVENSPADHYSQVLERAQSAFKRNSDYIEKQVFQTEPERLGSSIHSQIQARLEKNEQIIGKLVLLINELASLNGEGEDVSLLLDSLISQSECYLKALENLQAENKREDHDKNKIL